MLLIHSFYNNCNICIQSEAAREVENKQREELDVLKKLDLTQYAIKGSEGDWSNALTESKSSTMISIKR